MLLNLRVNCYYIFALLINTNWNILCILSDPQDAEVATMFLRDHPRYLSTARFWTDCYALPPGQKPGPSPQDLAVGRLADMGFPEDQCRNALERHNWDENAAVNFLLSNI